MLGIVHRKIKLAISKSQPSLGDWPAVSYVKVVCWVGQAQPPVEFKKLQVNQQA